MVKSYQVNHYYCNTLTYILLLCICFDSAIQNLKTLDVHRLIPVIIVWIIGKHDQKHIYITQLLTGHGCLRANMYRFEYSDCPYYTVCKKCADDAKHLTRYCSRFMDVRCKLMGKLQPAQMPESTIDHTVVQLKQRSSKWFLLGPNPKSTGGRSSETEEVLQHCQ